MVTIDADPVIRMILGKVLGAAGVVTDEATDGVADPRQSPEDYEDISLMLELGAVLA